MSSTSTTSLSLTTIAPPEEQEVPRYRPALAFFDAVLEHAASEGVADRDRLDAQSFMWAVATYKAEELPPSWPIRQARHREDTRREASRRGSGWGRAPGASTVRIEADGNRA